MPAAFTWPPGPLGLLFASVNQGRRGVVEKLRPMRDGARFDAVRAALEEVDRALNPASGLSAWSLRERLLVVAAICIAWAEVISW